MFTYYYGKRAGGGGKGTKKEKTLIRAKEKRATASQKE